MAKKKKTADELLLGDDLPALQRLAHRRKLAEERTELIRRQTAALERIADAIERLVTPPTLAFEETT